MQDNNGSGTEIRGMYVHRVYWSCTGNKTTDKESGVYWRAQSTSGTGR